MSRHSQRLVGAALGLSLAVHLAALGLLPDWRPSTPTPPPSMRVTLLPPPQPVPAPSPVSAAAPPPPAPAAPPQAAPAPKPVAPRPVLVARQAEAAPKASRITPPQAPSMPAPAATPMAAEAPAPIPSPAASSQAAVPHGPPSAPAEAAPAMDPAALARYGQILSDLLAQQQKYPRLAAARGWEGEVVLKLVIARKGQLVEAQVIRSSGHAVLDESALALVTTAQPFPAMPGQTTGGDLEVTVPVHYQLRKG